LVSPLGLYVHVPFCSAICNYCNFNRGLLDEALKRRYVDALVADIEQHGDGAAADAVYFGGGTPSLLDPGEIERVLSACRAAFRLDAGSEITLEANPETLSRERLDGFRAAGINRLSLGVQSFQDEELRRLGRIHDAARAREAMSQARAAGFDNVSLDLMLWLPGQTLGHWLASVEALIGLAPEHASLYLLELYPNAPLREEMARGGWAMPPDDLAAAMYLEGLDALDRAGYRQYEISNVARPGRESRHNLKYWTDGEWHAFGCGAHGTRGDVRWRNVPGTADYVDRIRTGVDPAAERRRLDPETRFGEAVFMGLRLVEGIDRARIAARYGVDPLARFGRDLDRFVEQGLLRTDGGRLRLTRAGFLLANEVMAVFV
jgi:oxygen-independent coproporphyrinogen-3 oxidase